MTQQAPWSIKGIKAGNREAAKELAGKNGLTIGELINNLIEEAEGRGPSKKPIRQPIPQPNQYFQDNQAQFGQASAAWAGYETVAQPNNDASRLANAMEALSRKLEGVANTNAPAPQAFNAPPPPRFEPDFGLNEKSRIDKLTERAIETMISRIEDNEKRTDRGFNQVSQSLVEIRQAQETIAERLRRIENDDPQHRSITALRNLEIALSRLATQFTETQERTANIERRLENDGRGKLSPDDVERILSQSNQNISQAFDGKLGQVSHKLEAIEQITTTAIEETDKGIGLLAERVKATEMRAQQTNDTLKEALVELSARLTNIEGQDTSAIRNEIASGFESRFSNLQNKIDEIGSSVQALVNEARVESESKFEALSQNLFERVNESEKETIAAIENIGEKLVETSENLGERLKAVEELNNNSKDNALAMRLELGRITRAIDERLSAIENRESDFIEKAGQHINGLAEKVSNRLDNFEGGSNNFVDRFTQETKNIADSLLSRQEEVTREFSQKLADIDDRINKRMDERFAVITREIHAAEDRAKSSNRPLQNGLDNLIDRLDQIESRTGHNVTETIKAPDYNYGAGQNLNDLPSHNVTESYNKPADTVPFTFDDEIESANIVPAVETLAQPSIAPNQAGGFGAATAKFGVEETDFVVNPSNAMAVGFNPAVIAETEFKSELGEDFDALANQKPDENGNYDFIQAIEENPLDALGGDEEWLSGLPASETNVRPQEDYLSRARRAAIEAASMQAENANAKKAKPQKKNNPAKSAQNTEVIPKPTVLKDRPKDAAKPGLSPIGIAAAAGLVMAVSAVGYNFIHNQQADKSELPASLQQEAVNTAPATPPPPAQEAVPVAPVPDEMATNAIAAPTSQLPGGVAMPAPKQIVPNELHGRTEPPAQKTDASGLVTKAPTPPAAATQVRPTPPTKAPNTAVQPNAAPKAPAPNVRPQANNGAPRIASAVAAPAPQANNAAAANQARQLYTQAMAKAQAGDNTTALQLLNRASDLGDTRAQNRLAKMYERGDGGVPRDLAKARTYTERAARSGSRQAQHNLGVYYAEGTGAPQDFARAAENFRSAARRGLADSQYNLGAMAEQGLGAQRNPREAYYWYSLASKSGDADAQRKASEVARNLSAQDKAAEDRRIAGFQAQAGGAE